jgi:DNA-binding NtrC family response regulator
MLMHEPAVSAAPIVTEPAQKGLKTLLEDYERHLILEALQATRGNQRQAAFALGILPTTLHEKLKRLGLFPLRRVEGGRVGFDSPQI